MIFPIAKIALQVAAGATAVTAVGVATGVVPTEIFKLPSAITQTQPTATVAKLPEDNKIVVPKVEAPKSETEEENTTQPQAKGPVIPEFDVLRVEKDGSLLAAGRAEPNSTVRLVMPDGSVIGETKIGPEGDFVILPNEFLAPGDYALSLVAELENGDKVTSAQTSIVHIPNPGGEVLAMISEEGQASRIIAKPKALEETLEEPVKPEVKPEEAAKETPVAVEQPAEPKSVEPKVVESKPAEEKPEEQVEIASPVTTKTPEVEVAKVEPDAAKPAEEVKIAKVEPPTDTKPTQVIVEAVEIEGSQVFVAGAVPRGKTVRAYINNKQLGDTTGTADDRFLIAKKFDLKPGKHVVRADVIDRKSGSVVTRAEVPLIHEVEPEVDPLAPSILQKEKPKIVEPKVETPKVAVVEPQAPKKEEVIAQTVAKVIEPQPQPQPAAKKIEPVVQPQPAEPMSVVVQKSAVEIEEVKAEVKVAATEAPAGPLPIRTGTAVIIKPGDNLWRISRKTYGRGIRYTTIYNANRSQIRDPNRIYIGQIFKIPEKTEDGIVAKTSDDSIVGTTQKLVE